MENFEPGRDYFPDKVSADYSGQWDVKYHGHYKVLTVTSGPGGHGAVENVTARTYVLSQCGTPAPELTGDLDGAQLVSIPITRAVDENDTMIASFQALGPGMLVGLSNTHQFADSRGFAQEFPEVIARIKNGEIEEIGYGATLNLERVLEMRPDVMFAGTADPSVYQRLRAAGVAPIYYLTFNETPLGAAEQIELLSLLTNKEAQANEHTKGVVTRFEKIATIARRAATRPTVLFGTTGMGGSDFSAYENDYFDPALAEPAGGAYALDLPGSGRRVLSMEQIIAEAGDADFWYRSGYDSGATASDIIALDPRAAQITPLRAGKAIRRANTWVQSNKGHLNPDEVLADLAAILHPELFPDHEPRFLETVPVD